METVHNIKMYACLNYLFEKSHVKYMHAALLLYFSDFIMHTQKQHGLSFTSLCINGGQKAQGSAFWSQNAWSALA